MHSYEWLKEIVDSINTSKFDIVILVEILLRKEVQWLFSI